MAVPQVDVARARAFVLAHGSAVDVARMEGLLGRAEPDRAVVKALERLQNVDGGFPAGAEAGGSEAARGITTAAGGLGRACGVTTATDGPGMERDITTTAGVPGGAHGTRSNGASSVAATCQVLAQLRDIPPLAGSPMASRAVAFLRRSQAVDGSWSEPQTGVGPALLTASAAYTLAVMEPDHPDPIVRAARWLRRTLTEAAGNIPLAGVVQAPADGTENTGAEGAKQAPADVAENTGVEGAEQSLADGALSAVAGSALSPALFLAAAVWGHTGDGGAQDSAYTLLEGRDLTASELAGWLTTFVDLGLAARHFALVLRLLERLAAMQQADGSWPGGEGSAVEATLAALRVFRGFGLAMGGRDGD